MEINDKSANPPTPVTKKKPYEKPTFRYEKVFVTTALSCGKIANAGFQCNSNPKVS